MRSTEPTTLQLANELEDAYGLITHALPLALRTLKTADPSLIEQRGFWVAIELMERHVNVLDLDSDDGPLDNGPGGIEERMDELMELRISQPTESSRGNEQQ